MRKKKMVETKTFNWLEEALLRRKAQESSVVMFQSTDPERISQFRIVIEQAYQKAMLSENEKIEKFFLYDPFTGLLDARTGEAVKPQTQGPLAGLISNGKIKDINAACDALEEHLRAYTTIVLIQGLSTQKEPLQYALRAFATNGEVYKTKSTVFIFAPNANAVLDDYTRDLAVVIDIPISLEQERMEIADKIVKELGIKTEPSAIISSAGLDLHMTESAFLESVFRKRKLDTEEIAKFKGDIVRKTGILEIENPVGGFEMVGGYSIVKHFIRNTIIKVIQNPDKAKELGLTLPRGILFFGPPGTGKTLFARAMASEVKLTFCNLKTENIFTSLVGETERKLASAIKVIDAISPSIVLVDEAERLGTRASVSTDSGTSHRFLSQILSWLGEKERKSIIIMTANMPEQLDPALLRAGRLDYLIPVLYPNTEARLQILKVHTSIVRKIPLADDVNLSRVAAATELTTGAELEALCLRAARNAFTRNSNHVTEQDFNTALTGFKIDAQRRKEQLDHYMKLAESYTTDAQFLSDLKKEAGCTRIEAAKAQLDSEKLREELGKIT